MHNLDDIFNLLALKTLHDLNRARSEVREREAQECANYDPFEYTRGQYELMAANGQELAVRCDKCSREVRFLPQHAGGNAACVHCGAPIVLLIPRPSTPETEELPRQGN